MMVHEEEVVRWLSRRWWECWGVGRGGREAHLAKRGSQLRGELRCDLGGPPVQPPVEEQICSQPLPP